MADKLTAAAILAADDIPQETVAVPEWGGDVLVRGLTARDRDAFEAETVRYGKGKGSESEMDLRNVRARLLVRTLYDLDGNRLFADADVDALGAKSAAVLTRLFETARKLSGMGDDTIKEAEKN